MFYGRGNTCQRQRLARQPNYYCVKVTGFHSSAATAWFPSERHSEPVTVGCVVHLHAATCFNRLKWLRACFREDLSFDATSLYEHSSV